MKTRRWFPSTLAFGLAVAISACGVDRAMTPNDGGGLGGPQFARKADRSIGSLSTESTASVGDIEISLGDGVTIASCPQSGYDSTSAVLGTWGGYLQLGKHRLTVPPGALSKNTKISMVRLGDETASVRFHPHGLVFPKDARPVLTLNFGGCQTSPKPFVVYTTDDLRILELLPTLDLDRKNQKVTTELDHFSRYAVAW